MIEAWFRPFLKILTLKQRHQSFWVIFLMTIGVALEAVTLGLVAPISSFIMGEGGATTELPGLFSQLDPGLFIGLVTGGGILFVILKNVFVACQIRTQYSFTAEVKQSISSKLLENYLRAPFSFHLTRNSSELIRNVINEVNEFEIRVLIPLMLLISEGLIAVGLLSVLLILNPVNTLAVGVILVVSGIVYLAVTRRIVSRWGKIRLESEEQRIRSVQQSLGGIKEVKLHGLEESSLQSYEVHNTNSAKSFAVQAVFSQMPRLLLEVVVVAAVLVVVLISFMRDLPTEEMIVGLGLLAAAAFRLLPSMNRIISACSSLRFGAASFDTISRELDQSIKNVPGSREGEKGALQPLLFRDSINLQNVSFAYEGVEKPVLENVSLEIPRNSFVGIVGESGSGKSTLIDIVLGILPPASGTVKVDGVSIHENLRSWQDRLAYVPQNIFLGDTTIRENVALGIPPGDIDEDRVLDALRGAHVETFVKNLPDGLDTKVGERGVRLSGGQCQRIGIARALYREPEVIVFDEATSALDDASQDKVMEAIRELKGSRTIILVSHRLSTIKNCDVVYRVTEGVIKQERSASLMEL